MSNWCRAAIVTLINLFLILHVDGQEFTEKLKKLEESLALGKLGNFNNSTGFRLLGGEDKYLNTSQLLRKYGYPAEEYSVVTEDGYNLTVFRAPSTGPAVFLMHGLLSSSDDFLTLGPDDALVYLLFNEGYDVWLGNARGTKYSRRHVRLSPEDQEYWDFSWHEIGYYDLPAMIDEALRISNRTQLTYIGHSQGTTVYYVMSSLKPEYNSKVGLSVSMAPVSFIWRFKPVFVRALVPFWKELLVVAKALGIRDVLPESPVTKFVTSILCNTSNFALILCISALFAVFGYDFNQVNLNTLPIQLSHVPSGSSVLQVAHYAQLISTRNFTQFDYGKEENLGRYGSEDPPIYPVQKITSPAVLFYGPNDKVSVLDDVQLLADRLPNVIGVYRVPHFKFNHFDHIWARNAKTLVYYKVLEILKTHT